MGGLEAARRRSAIEEGHGRAAPAAHRADRSRDAGRSRALPRSRHGWLSLEADRRRRADRDRRAVRRRRCDRSVSGHRGSRRTTRSSTSAPRSAYTGGDRRLLKEVVTLFRADYPSSLRKIDRALRRRDPEALRLAAHAPEGSNRDRRCAGGPAGRRGARADGSRARTSTRPGTRTRSCVRRSSGSRTRFAAAEPDLAPGATARLPARTRRLASTKAKAIMSRILVVDDDKATRHVLRSVLTSAGFSTAVAKDGVEALKALRSDAIRPAAARRLDAADERARSAREAPHDRGTAARRRDDVRRCAGNAAEGRARTGVQVRAQAGGGSRSSCKPFARRSPRPTRRPIEVISARPEWVELVVPCTREAAGHIEAVMSHLDADLAPDVRESIGYAFRELLLNAVEWGGKLDPSRTVRIACLRAKRMVMYRIADPGTRIQHRGFAARRDRPAARRPDRAHASPRGEGHSSRRLRPADGARQRRRAALQRAAERGRVREGLDEDPASR